ncbi:MAG: DUF6624 domain-containing protein [Betaproteobacteria bacterium]
MTKINGLLLAWLISFCTLAVAQQPSLSAPDKSRPAPDWPAIAADLESMHKGDQSLRMELTELTVAARAKGAELDKATSEAIWKKINEQDGANQKRVAVILDTYGWPPKSKVGAEASTTAFLVVQHAGLDYQVKYMESMRAAVDSGEAAKQQFALLEDRVLLRQGKSQRFGSQVDTTGGVGLRSVEDPDNLDKRRATMGLGPICQYLEYFVKQAGPIVYPPCVKTAASVPAPAPASASVSAPVPVGVKPQ